MATQESIAAYTRLLLGDNKTAFQAVVTGDGATRRYELPNSPIETSGFTLVRLDPNTLLMPNDDYILDADNGVVVLTEAPDAGVSVIANGHYYTYFTEDEIVQFVIIAFSKHTHNRIDPVDGLAMTYGDLPAVEEHLVAILAAIEGLWVLATDAADDIDIVTPEGVSIPASQRYAQLVNQIRMLEERYKETAALLNVGLGRIEMFNLRRVSRTTNRLIPIYTAKEYDDRTPPVRQYPPIDRGA